MNRPTLATLLVRRVFLTLFVFASCCATWKLTTINGTCPSSCLCAVDNYSSLAVGNCSRENIDRKQLSEQIDSLLSSNLTYRYLTYGQLAGFGIVNTPLLHVPRSVCRLTTLQRLYLNSNSLTRLPDNCFTNLTALTILAAQFGRITKLQVGVFDGLHKLKELYLNSNNITELPDGIFDKLRMLVTLALDNNRISSIGSRVFDGLSRLKLLYLQTNHITQLPDGIFDGLRMLTTLDVSDNRISSIGSRTFGGSAITYSLSYVNLSYNRIPALDSWPIYMGINQALKIELSGNRVHRFTNMMRWKKNCDMRKVHFNLLLDRNPIMMPMYDLLSGWDMNLFSTWCISAPILTSYTIIINYVYFDCDCLDFVIFSLRLSPNQYNIQVGKAICNNRSLILNQDNTVPLDQFVCELTERVRPAVVVFIDLQTPLYTSTVPTPTSQSFHLSCHSCPRATPSTNWTSPTTHFFFVWNIATTSSTRPFSMSATQTFS